MIPTSVQGKIWNLRVVLIETSFGLVTFHEVCKSNFATFATVYQIELIAYLQDVFLSYPSHLLELVYHKFRFTVAWTKSTIWLTSKINQIKAKKQKRLFFDKKLRTLAKPKVLELRIWLVIFIQKHFSSNVLTGNM